MGTETSVKVKLLDEEKICGYIPKLTDIECIDELKRKGIVISDKENVPSDILLLLGADVISQMYTGNVMYLETGPCAFETRFGWTIMGKTKGNSKASSVLSLTNVTNAQALWEIETVGILEPIESVKPEFEIKHFEENVTQLSDGRYEVKMPWSYNITALQTNFEKSKARLLGVYSKLLKKGLVKEYETVFEEWEKLGIVEKVPLEPEVGHFLSHHPVIREQSLTTKIRPVFDASMKDGNQICLNDCLTPGPNLLQLVPNLLTRFRMKRLGVNSDITKAFLQISICPEDRQYFKFLWFKGDKLVCYRHNRVVFGVVNSPFLLNATIIHHLNKAPPELQKLSDTLKYSFYCDDFCNSVDDDIELKELIKGATEYMRQAKLEFKDWIYAGCGKKDFSILGVKWDIEQDCLYYPIEEIRPTAATKRSILSVVKKLTYDPIGYTYYQRY